MKYSPKIIGLLQALGLSIYVALFVFIGFNFSQWHQIPIEHLHPMVATTVFLLAFITSALICGSIALAYPAMLFFDGKKWEAAKIVFATAIWLILIFATVIIVSFFVLM